MWTKLTSDDHFEPTDSCKDGILGGCALHETHMSLLIFLCGFPLNSAFLLTSVKVRNLVSSPQPSCESVSY